MFKFLIYILIGLSLSVDAFTIAVSYGTVINRIRDKYLLVILIGIFHFIMPVIGSIIAKVIESVIIIKPKYIVFIIFLLLIIEMINDSQKNEQIKKIGIVTLLLISFVVSIDSLSIGVILGLTKEKVIVASTIFSIISSIITLIGINIGIKLKHNKNSNIIGIILLCLVALKYLIFG